VAGVTGLEPAASGVTGRSEIAALPTFSNYYHQKPTRCFSMGYGHQFERPWLPYTIPYLVGCFIVAALI